MFLVGYFIIAWLGILTSNVFMMLGAALIIGGIHVFIRFLDEVEQDGDWVKINGVWIHKDGAYHG